MKKIEKKKSLAKIDTCYKSRQTNLKQNRMNEILEQHDGFFK